MAIKSLSRLLSKQNSKHNGKQYFCMNCLQGFKEEKSRDKHVGYCKDNESVRIEMPHKRLHSKVLQSHNWRSSSSLQLISRKAYGTFNEGTVEGL